MVRKTQIYTKGVSKCFSVPVAVAQFIYNYLKYTEKSTKLCGKFQAPLVWAIIFLFICQSAQNEPLSVQNENWRGVYFMPKNAKWCIWGPTTLAVFYKWGCLTISPIWPNQKNFNNFLHKIKILRGYILWTNRAPCGRPFLSNA